MFLGVSMCGHADTPSRRCNAVASQTGRVRFSAHVLRKGRIKPQQSQGLPDENLGAAEHGQPDIGL